jgi:hypothetical protein
LVSTKMGRNKTIRLFSLTNYTELERTTKDGQFRSSSCRNMPHLHCVSLYRADTMHPPHTIH